MDYLTSLRGMAALLVVLFHVKQHLQPLWPFSLLYPLFVNGYLAVDYFLVLSGFIISYKYHHHFQHRIRGHYYDFIAKRLARIYPLHAFVLLCYIAIPVSLVVTGRAVSAQQFGIYQFVCKLFLVDLWTLDGVTWNSWNVPSWTISGEFFAYLTFPAFVYVFQAANRYFKALLLGVAFIVLAAAYHQMGCSTIGACNGQLGLMRCGVEFLLGMGVFFLRKHLPGFSKGASVAVTVASLGALAVCFQSTVPNYFYVPILFATTLFGLLGLTGVVHHVLESKFLVYLGDISYSVYLTHELLADILSKIFLKNDQLAGPVLILSYVGLTLGWSAITYRFIELPLRSWLYQALRGNGEIG